MAEQLDHDPTVAPAAEAIHMPEPSLLPATLALGIAFALIGILTSIVVSAIGVIITVVVLVKWIRSAREEMAELPLDHSAH